MAKHVDRFTELTQYGELRARSQELLFTSSHLNSDRYVLVLDEDLEVLRYNAYVAIEKYRKALDKYRYGMFEDMYGQLQFADTYKPKKSFRDIFKRKGS